MNRTINCILTLLVIVSFSVPVLGQVRKIEMTKSGGVYHVPCVVNNIPMQFIFDTGASGILLSKEAVQMMAAKGAFAADDIVGMSQSQIANGDIVEGVVIKLRSFAIGGVWVKNLTAQVSLSLNAPLLLGTDVLERFGSLSVDYHNNLLLLGDESNPFMEEVSKMFRLHKYVWGATSEEVETLEHSEKLRVKLITGQYSDWKTTSSFTGSLILNYKMRVAGLVLNKSYTFDENKLNIEMFKVLQQGLVTGNPDLNCHDVPLDLAYRLYFKLDSMIREESTAPFAICLGSGYDCIHSPYSESAVYGQFFDASQLPLDLSSKGKFQETIQGLLVEARDNKAIRSNERIEIIQRRSTYSKDGYYELNIATEDANKYDVWLVIRQKLD